MHFLYNNKLVKIKVPAGTGNVGRIIRKGRFYEKNFLEYIARQNISGTYIDVGANIGNHTLFFAMFTRADHVISIEPNKKIFTVLKENIKDNNIDNRVTAYNVAAGDKRGRVSIKPNPKDEIGGTQVVEGNEVSLWKLDKFIKEKIGLIKIDVEGYETQVLKGAKKILEEHKPELLIEAQGRMQLKEINKILKNYGYKPHAVYNNTATYHFSVHGPRNRFSYRITKPRAIRRLIRYS